MLAVQSEGWGQIEIVEEGLEELRSAPLGSGSQVQGTHYCWRPVTTVAQHVGPTFAIYFYCYRDGAGRRRFVQRGSYGGYIQLAFQAGRAIRRERDRLTEQQLVQLDILWNCYQRVQRMHEKSDRLFRTKADLTIRWGAREQSDEETVLPLQLGATPQQPAERWTIAQLLEHGRQHAQAAGLQEISQATAIQYGLFAAAEQNPLVIPDSETAALIRLALFELEGVDIVDEAMVDGVLNRLKQAHARHETDSHPEFWRWFNDNAFKSLANQTGDDLGKLDSSQVRSALLEIGWRGHRSVARCLETFAQAFAAALPEPLHAEENELFSVTYEPQSFLGNLPLVMLLDRSSFLKPVVMKFWAEPNNPKWRGVLLRLLQYYGEMVSPRRAADRRTKQSSTGNKSASVQFPQAKQSGENNRDQSFTETQAAKDPHDALLYWQHVLEKLGIGCQHPDCTELPRLLSHQVNAVGVHTLNCACPDHGALAKQHIPDNLFRAANPFGNK